MSEQAKKFMVIMNAATSIITTKSNYSARVSMTLPQATETIGAWAYKSGIRKAYTMVSDYGPGHDAEGGFQRAFKAAGGEIVGQVRMPVQNPDFSAFVQRAKDLNPESIFIFVPAGAQPGALGKAFAERGIDPKKIKILGTGEVTAESAVKSMGDAALDIITGWHYDFNHDSPLNKQFVGGEQQMAAIASALMINPALLLLDEPLEGLAPIIVEELVRAVRRMSREEGTAVVLVEQHAEVALSLTDHAVILERASIVHRAPSAQLLRYTATLERLIGLRVEPVH